MLAELHDFLGKTLFYSVIGFVLCMFVPALRQMLFNSLGALGGEASVRLFNTVVYVTKEVFRAHTTILWHLSRRRKDVFLTPEKDDVGGIAKEKIKQ